MGKVYVGEGTPVGWVFQKKTEYTDCSETYLREVWVTLHEICADCLYYTAYGELDGQTMMDIEEEDSDE